jgi:serine/threonine protein kinase
VAMIKLTFFLIFLQPENLLIDGSGNVKLCDFGWSAESRNSIGGRTTFCGTVDYMPPEMIGNKPHDHRVDIWCLGILLYELVHGYAPFMG